MSDDSDPRRDAIHAFVQQQGPPGIHGSAVLTGWVLVTEWMDEDGERWLARGWSSSLAKWHADGVMHEALYGQWPADDDDE